MLESGGDVKKQKAVSQPHLWLERDPKLVLKALRLAGEVWWMRTIGNHSAALWSVHCRPDPHCLLQPWLYTLPLPCFRGLWATLLPPQPLPPPALALHPPAPLLSAALCSAWWIGVCTAAGGFFPCSPCSQAAATRRPRQPCALVTANRPRVQGPSTAHESPALRPPRHRCH